MDVWVLPAKSLPVVTAAERQSRVLGFASTPGEARVIANIWGDMHRQKVVGLTASRRFWVNPDTAVNSARTIARATAAQRAWLVLFDDAA